MFSCPCFHFFNFFEKKDLSNILPLFSNYQKIFACLYHSLFGLLTCPLLDTGYRILVVGLVVVYLMIERLLRRRVVAFCRFFIVALVSLPHDTYYLIIKNPPGMDGRSVGRMDGWMVCLLLYSGCCCCCCRCWLAGWSVGCILSTTHIIYSSSPFFVLRFFSTEVYSACHILFFSYLPLFISLSLSLFFFFLLSP